MSLKRKLITAFTLLSLPFMTIFALSAHSVKCYPSHVQRKQGEFLIVHLTDLHLSTRAKIEKSTPITHKIIISDYKLHRVNLYQSINLFTKAIQLINNAIQPDILVISGDLVNNREDTKAYEFIYEELKKLKCPYFIVLGDHDVSSTGDYNP